jgi:hypothetical protein
MISHRYTVLYRPQGMKPMWNETLTWETKERLETPEEIFREADERIDFHNNYPTYGWTIDKVEEETITLTRTVTP